MKIVKNIVRGTKMHMRIAHERILVVRMVGVVPNNFEFSKNYYHE
jgi:hypothetical protein